MTEHLGMRHIVARLIPRTLNFLQKHLWFYEYDLETSQQSSEWRCDNEPKPKKRQGRLKIKILLTVFFDYRGVVHEESLPPGQMVNKE